jgi:gentisate 1,2-dioxygenase
MTKKDLPKPDYKVVKKSADAEAILAATGHANVVPGWMGAGPVSGKPAFEPAYLWPWASLGPLVDLAARSVSTEEAERRILILTNPAFAGTDRFGATANLFAALQVLLPGERARPHRHAMNAIRFVIEGGGAKTIVDGKDCPMEPGDLILTPGWTWHEHVHEGTERVVWFDGLDHPIHQYLYTVDFEPGPPSGDMPPQIPDAAFSSGGLTPEVVSDKAPYSPMFRYPWQAAIETLNQGPPAPDGSRKLRYTNPVTGGSVMEMLDCYILQPPSGAETTPTRSTSNTICFVAEGDGVSQIGEVEIKWSKNDIFSMPHGQWASHRASSQETILFQLTDREFLRRAGLLKDEIRTQ